MRTLATFSGLGAPETVFLFMLSQFALAIWLSYRCYRAEPHWKTLSVLGSLLLLGIPGFTIVRVIRAGFRGFSEGTRGAAPPESR